MSDHRDQVVDVSSRQRDAGRVDAVRSWLLSSGWAQADETAEDWLERDAESDAVGPRARELFSGLSGTVTVVRREHAQWWAGGDTGAPRCRNCGTQGEDPAFFEGREERWTPTQEPKLQCESCGWAAPIGDWDLSESGATGNPCIVLDTPSAQHFGGDVAERLAEELDAAVGGRWRWVHLHL